MMKNSMPICIAGMHYSGMSIVSTMLAACGVYFGEQDDLLSSIHGNSNRFWKHREFSQINDEILKQFGGGSHRVPIFNLQCAQDSQIRHLAETLVIKMSKTRTPWVWKDEHNSLTLPFWNDLLPDLTVIACLRNPLEVVSSLRQRNLSSYECALSQWQIYYQQLLDDTFSRRQIVVHYDNLFTNTEYEVQRLIEFLGMPFDEQSAGIACDTLKPELRHHSFSFDDLIRADLPRSILDLYVHLCEETEWSGFQLPQAKTKQFDVQKISEVAPSLDTAQIDNQGRYKPITFGKIAMESQHASNPSNPIGTPTAELKRPQHHPRNERSPHEHQLKEFKDDLGDLRLQLEAIQGQTRAQEINGLDRKFDELDDVRDQLGGATRESKELRSQLEALHHEVDKLQETLNEILANQKPANSTGEETPQQTEYRQMIHRMRNIVREHLPLDASVFVVSRGDEELLKLYGRRASHFPQNMSGEYLGHYPGNCLAAIAQTQALRVHGADYLVFPQPAMWWLSHYAEFARFLQGHYRQVVNQEDTCVIYSLKESAIDTEKSPLHKQLEEAFTECEARSEDEPSLLDWHTKARLAEQFPDRIVLSPSTDDQELPYIEASIDIVAVASSDPVRLAEARRIARFAVVHVSHDANAPRSISPATIEWKEISGVKSLPTTSIIIPCHNAVAYTEACLKSLFDTIPKSFQVEVIVIDDASTDETPRRLKRLMKAEHRLKVLRNETNVGFLASCNRGAEAATGNILLFLNNDTILLPGWLPPLLRVFVEHPDAGAVGGKLLFADGSLQEAGGLVFRDGSADHFGREDQDIESPFYNYVRTVDYCSGALLATKRSLFFKIGGFDLRFMPGYYEDTDYCFSVREHGLRVYYQPDSMIVHFEGVTGGRNLSVGPKRYQVVNQEKFAKKWEKSLQKQQPRWRGRTPDYFLTAAADDQINGEVIQ